MVRGRSRSRRRPGLLAREAVPVRAPCVLGSARASLSFLDGRLIATQPGVFLRGDVRRRAAGQSAQRRPGAGGPGDRAGLCGGRGLQRPDREPGRPRLHPALFGVAWLVGFALRERDEQSEAAEERARRAERERESAARVAVAEERARMARELHDVVAHAVSVMVLQVGAVRHRMPAASEEGEALATSSRPAARRSPRCAGCSARSAAGRRPARADAASRPGRPRDAGGRRPRRRARRTPPP